MHAWLFLHSDPNVRQTEIEKRMAEAHISPFDVTVIDSGTDSIGIAETRSFITYVSLSSANGDKRAGVIVNADRLTTEAQQALLKTLEEPPARALFFLGSANDALLLPTILSRCVSVRIPDSTEPTTAIDASLFRTTSPGHIISMISAIGKTKEAYVAWIDEQMYALHHDSISNATILKTLLSVKKLLPNNVHPQFLLEHVFLTRYNDISYGQTAG